MEVNRHKDIVLLTQTAAPSTLTFQLTLRILTVDSSIEALSKLNVASAGPLLSLVEASSNLAFMETHLAWQVLGTLCVSSVMALIKC